MDTASPDDATSPVGEDHVDHLLAQWAERRPELDTGPLGITARIVRLSRYLDRTAAEHLAPYDLHEGEVNVLAALRRSPPPHVLTPTELYQALLVSSGAMTNRLDRLESAGLLRRTPDEDDRRKVRVGLTAAGRTLIDDAIDAHVAALADRFAHLSPADADALADLLRRLLLPLEADRPDA